MPASKSHLATESANDAPRWLNFFGSGDASGDSPINACLLLLRSNGRAASGTPQNESPVA